MNALLSMFGRLNMNALLSLADRNMIFLKANSLNLFEFGNIIL